VIAAQQIRVTPGDAPASEQAKSDHGWFPQLAGTSRSGSRPDLVPIVTERLANQGIRGRLHPPGGGPEHLQRARSGFWPAPAQ
jgi:hypothetical protein